MATQPWLGLCLIVRDAEKTIKTLLESVSGVFDEVIVVDTGSKDSTKQILMDHFGTGIWGESRFVQAGANGVSRLVLTDFAWVDDFSAARQFAFDLGTAKWRMYLDADDKAEFKYLREMLAATEKNSPSSNCVSLKYDYVKNQLAQDTIRLVRWADGWRFEDPVHEHLVAVGHPRIISKYEDVWVRHVPADPQHATHSFERNLKIQEKAYLEAKTPEKRALWAYYLACCADQIAVQDPSKYDLARKFYREVGDGLGRNNIACEGLTRWARMEMRLGNLEKAIELSAEAIGKAPELPDGLAALGVAQLLADAPYRAAGVFDLMAALSKPVMETQHDAVWLDGVVNARAAQTYYRIGRITDAGKALQRIPEPLLKHPEVFELVRPLTVSLQKTEGFDRLKALWEFLIWDTEPLKARQLLEEFCPASLSDSPQVKDLLRQMEPKLAHMKNWNAYQRAYAAIPDEPYHVPAASRDWTLLQGRARALRLWAEGLPKEGPAIEVLVIGIQDGIIEGAMLGANSRINLTACDVAPQASRGINELVERFPGRVKTHQVKEAHYDWFPAYKQASRGEGFDAVVLFEVLEHLPVNGDYIALRLIREHLKPEGKLFLSTPIAASWVESYLSDLKSPRPWWHVRAHNPTSLWELFREVGFTGSIAGLGGEELFLAVMTPVDPWEEEEISIYCYPMKPLTEGFDPFSIKTGHTGGSEEAVIHLSAAFARKGCKVTVYADMPVRKDKVFVHQGAQWRTHAELDVPSLEGTLLVWRAPQIAASFKRQNPRVRVLNWLHDAASGVRPEIYEAVDGTIVLSKFHADVIERYDGYRPKLLASNGIVPSEFPEPDESKRDPHAAIYASAPNRGLDFLLDCWPLIRAAVPDATLRIYYSWVLTEKMLEKRPDPWFSALLARLRSKIEALKDSGVTYIGGVDHATLNEAYRTSGVWTYPVGFSGPNPVDVTEGAFEEISCISAMRAQASGCWPVVAGNGALPETCKYGRHISAEKNVGRAITMYTGAAYANAVIEEMRASPFAAERLKMRAWALEQNWDKAAGQFLAHAKAKNERITIFAGGFGRRFDAAGAADGRNLGGSEEAVIAMAKALVEKGKEVFVYAPLPEGSHVVDGATWIDSSKFDPAGPHGTLLAWRCPKLVPVLKGNGYPVILWLMDPEYGAQPCDYDDADAVVFLTESHKDIIQRKDGYDGGGNVVHVGLPELPDITVKCPPIFDNSRTQTDPVLRELANRPARDPKAVMWAVSPDRGLLEFLREVWPKVIAQVPDAKLHIFYGLEPLEKAGKFDLVEQIRNAYLSMETSVTYHGGVPDAELYDWYQRCSIFAYPGGGGFEETQSISTCKAMALGCYPIVGETGCLREVVSFGDGLAYPSDQYLGALVSALSHDITGREQMAKRAREAFSIEAMVTKMLKVIGSVR